MTAIAYAPSTERTARTLNTQALALDAKAAGARAHRDAIIRALRASAPKVWTYAALAKAIGLSVSQVTRICKA